jgi:hypothetical protein
MFTIEMTKSKGERLYLTYNEEGTKLDLQAGKPKLYKLQQFEIGTHIQNFLFNSMAITTDLTGAVTKSYTRTTIDGTIYRYQLNPLNDTTFQVSGNNVTRLRDITNSLCWTSFSGFDTLNNAGVYWNGFYVVINNGTSCTS